jgi:hypothetical protein
METAKNIAMLSLLMAIWIVVGMAMTACTVSPPIMHGYPGGNGSHGGQAGGLGGRGAGIGGGIGGAMGGMGHGHK